MPCSATTKVLKPGPRLFWAFGSLCVLVFCLMFFGGLRNRGWSDAAKDATWAFALPIIALGPIALVRVEVDAHEIRYQNFGIVWKRAQFDDIGRSFANVLGEKDWPVSLTLIAKDGKTELMVIRLKMLRKQDVDWLLSLPQLKLKR